MKIVIFPYGGKEKLSVNRKQIEVALKGSGAHSAKSYPSYVLWDTGSFDVHHRVTHES